MEYSLQNLPKDAIIQIALGLELEYLLNYCLISKRFNNFVCDNEDYWLMRIRKENPGVTNLYIYNKSYKDLYFDFEDSLDQTFYLNVRLYHENPVDAWDTLIIDMLSMMRVSISKYIPPEDVVDIIISTLEKLSNTLNVKHKWYHVIIDDTDPVVQGDNLSRELFNRYDRNVVVVDVDMISGETHPHIDDINKILQDSYNYALSNYIESLDGTDKEFLVKFL